MKRLMLPGALVVVIGVMVWIFGSAFGKDTHEVPFMLKGKPAPAFALKSLQTGETLTLESLKNKPIVMNFWATWCGPCAQEHPVLEWGAKHYADKVNFVGVVFEDTEESAKDFIARRGAHFPQLFDTESRITVQYGAAGVPETYFIDTNGIIVDKYVGPIGPEELTRRISDLVARSKPAAAVAPTGAVAPAGVVAPASVPAVQPASVPATATARSANP